VREKNIEQRKKNWEEGKKGRFLIPIKKAIKVNKKEEGKCTDERVC